MNLRLIQTPSPGTQIVRYVGDTIEFTLQTDTPWVQPPAWQARLRTNLGRGAVLRKEIIRSVLRNEPLDRSSWRDIPMQWDGQRWRICLPLAEVGYFEAKAYVLDRRGWQYWPEGLNVGLNVQPHFLRRANTIYCAFVRLFGPSQSAVHWHPRPERELIAKLEQLGYHVIPYSGTLKGLIRQLPHIFERLGCRYLHLLPIFPTPTVYARLGRMGSPYASLDMTMVDPALIEWDRRTTGLEQFEELAYRVHSFGGRLILDVAINHTGWSSRLHEEHPDWFVKNPDGSFRSPGAWGVVWEDLVELKHNGDPQLREIIAEALLHWCRRGVDGFRCDAGYMVPLETWRYIVARVREEFPNTIFLLEGLGGPWETTERLVAHANMQWAYSELFQNYSAEEIQRYLDYAHAKSQQVGLFIHYSETHDNPRLAVRGKEWSLLRNRICALTSVNGGFGFTCGVEWLAQEKIDVHDLTGLAWGQHPNIVEELARLNRLLADHPCFFADAKLERISPDGSPVYGLLRTAKGETAAVLVLINPDQNKPHRLVVPAKAASQLGLRQASQNQLIDLLGQDLPRLSWMDPQTPQFELPPASAFCLSLRGTDWTGYGKRASILEACRALAMQTVSEKFSFTCCHDIDWDRLAQWLWTDPAGFLGFVAASSDQAEACVVFSSPNPSPPTGYVPVIEWDEVDAARVVPCPWNHWVLVRHPDPFRLSVRIGSEQKPENIESTPTSIGHVAFLKPLPHQMLVEATLELEPYGKPAPTLIKAKLLYCPESPTKAFPEPAQATDVILLTNGKGSMACVRADLFTIMSKYDCILAANLNPRAPADRHLFVKRMRVWVNADGFLLPLYFAGLQRLELGKSAKWSYLLPAGDARLLKLELQMTMVPSRNTVIVCFCRPTSDVPPERQLQPGAIVSLTVRLDIEDRNFHSETQLTEEAKRFFLNHTKPLEGISGFEFSPAAGRRLLAYSTHGLYHHEPEWLYNIFHPVEASRGLPDRGDAFSPGWFEIPLPPNGTATLVITADEPSFSFAELADYQIHLAACRETGHDTCRWPQILTEALDQYIAERDRSPTVVAGYPWFLDWSRDTLIFCRGLIATGRISLARDILLNLAKYEQAGTLPNAFTGPEVQNRDTSDAALWFGILSEELSQQLTDPEAEWFDLLVPGTNRTIREVLLSIGYHYLEGTANGVRMDPTTGLVYSPAHFTWMDTNYPACTPRQGYPIEIQALWIRFLGHLQQVHKGAQANRWASLRKQALHHLETLFWIEGKGWFGDVIEMDAFGPATNGRLRNDLRPNCLLPIALDLLKGDKARRTVKAAGKWLLVPGALRSLAPLPVDPPLRLANVPPGLKPNIDPNFPYKGRYEGAEDVDRKPAYHNGTAWVYWLPIWCEALVKAWDYDRESIRAARAWLNTVEYLVWRGCLGHLPELLDGDFPHTERGCWAQAWSVSESVRIWNWLQRLLAT